MDTKSFIPRIEQAGFALAMDGDKLRITPASKLSDPQKAFIRTHRDDLIRAIRLRDKELEASSAGNDYPPANDDRVTVHIPEFQLRTGQVISFDATVPRSNLDRMRESVKFTLIDNQGGGSILGEPGKTHEELTEILISKYGNRLQSTY